jgi:hypothetical protein
MTCLGTSDERRDKLQALRRANEIRAARAELKRQVAEGALPAARVLLDPPPAASSWPVSELLMKQRHWGKAKCTRFLSRNQISESKPIGELTVRQRRLLAAQLEQAPPLAPTGSLARPRNRAATMAPWPPAPS